MQLTSMPPANISGSGPVIRSSTPPATMSSGVSSGSSAPETPATRPASSPERASAPNASRATPRPPTPASSAPETGSEPRNGRGGDAPSSARGTPEDRGFAAEASETRREESSRPNDSENNQDADEVSPERQAAVNELRSRDREVRQHEQAHQVVGGQYAGAPTYDYQRGPDGQLYATGGQVSIDTSPIPDDPQATINKMQVVRAAALAPAEPSPQDIQAAQEATSTMLAARAELQAERREETTGAGESSDEDSGPAPEGPEGQDDDPRIALFRDVDAFSDSPAQVDSAPRFEAIA